MAGDVSFQQTGLPQGLGPATAGEHRAIEIAQALRRVFRRVSFGYDVPQALVAVWTSCGPRFQLEFDLADDAPLDALVHWWLFDGRKNFPGIRPILDECLLKTLHTDHLRPVAGGGGATVPTPLFALLVRHRADLAERFDLGTPKALRVFPSGGRHRTSSWKAKFRNRPAPRPMPRMAGLPPLASSGIRAASLAWARISGFSAQPSGSRKFEPDVVQAPWRITARQNVPEPAVRADDTDFARDTFFYCMPAFDTPTLLNKVGPRAFTSRRRIGFWQWELEHFPPEAKNAMSLVDEIWCHSEHSAKAFRRATDKPVIKVPLPVSVPQVDAAPRSRFGLPADAFIVFTSFDGASAIARKNPFGAIRAFQAAFPRRQQSARLVIKAMNTKRDLLWRECLRYADGDARILVLDEVMDRPAYYGLLKACDVVLSLHRAEGFGRLMADSMAFGIPAIASAYSGNLDFMEGDNSWLVDGRLIPVLAGDYAFYRGQRWFEPDIDAAATALVDCFGDPDKRRSRGQAARMTMSERYSLEACGRAYRALLAQ